MLSVLKCWLLQHAYSKQRPSVRGRWLCQSSVSCARAGKYVNLEDTISGFKGILEGKYDDLPEMAFYMVGDITEVQVGSRLLMKF